MLFLFSLIVMRMSGAIALNPIFSQSGLPRTARAAFILVLSVMLYLSFPDAASVRPDSLIQYGAALLMELFFGLTLGFAMELSLMTVRFGTSIMDAVMGLNMAQVYDPIHGSQMTITAGLYNAFLVLLFFASNGHLRLLAIYFNSAREVPFGTVTFRPELAAAVLDMFREGILLGMQLAFPIIAMELLAETAVGILMRMIPQINVFSINFQMKIIVGLFMLLFMFSPMSDKLYAILNDMYLSMEGLAMLVRPGA